MLPNAFVTLLTTPSYLPGALVLLHSLLELHPAPRDFKTVCLVTPETVDVKTIGELRKAGWDFVIGVEGIGSGYAGEEGLKLMGRPDLNLALTKLHLFRLHTLFSTLIYLDADVLPLRPISHLFQTTNPHVLSACPDTGWPDCFNSGVMVIRPRESDWVGLRQLLKNGEGEEGIYLEGGSGNGSFDGADQGLLNEWFSEEGGGGDWNRLPFLYNVTPTGAYQYKPAYTRYGHKINCVHFIGPNKPWANLSGRPAGVSLANKDQKSFDYPSLIDRWYNVYDRHIRPTAAHSPDLAHRFAVPEHVAVWNLASGVPVQPDDRLDLTQLRDAVDKGVTALKPGQYISLPLDGRVDLIMPKPKPREIPAAAEPSRPKSPSALTSPPHSAAPLPQTLEQQTVRPAAWDASREAPPPGGGPEMAIPMNTFYEPAWEQHPSQHRNYYAHPQAAPQPYYPTLPSSVTGDTWYKDYHGKVPDRSNIKAVFPWEQAGQQHRRPDRVFPRGDSPPPQPQPQSQASHDPVFTVQQPTPPIPSPPRQPSPPPRSMVEAMASYTNAWDTDPSIQRYINRITGKPGAPHHISIRERDMDNLQQVIHSVPSTPRYESNRPFGHGHARESSADRRSDVSGDGDDEDEGDDDAHDHDDASSPRVAFTESFRPGQVKYPSNENYRDRQAQTDNPALVDAKVQAIPGGGPSPALKTFDLPKIIAASGVGFNPATPGSTDPAGVAPPTSHRRPRPSQRQSSSSDTTPKAGPITPPSDTLASGNANKRLPFPTRTSGGSSGSGFGNGNGIGLQGGVAGGGGANPPGHARRTSNIEPIPTAPNITAQRYFDPSTDVDVRKRDTQAVLSRFMRVGTFSQSPSVANDDDRTP